MAKNKEQDIMFLKAMEDLDTLISQDRVSQIAEKKLRTESPVVRVYQQATVWILWCDGKIIWG